ncbi:MAG TPA: hypothetical protein VKB33_06915, partial [Nitrospira sp.]|nr:hypothetical protein [Nitrospira sp.]
MLGTSVVNESDTSTDATRPTADSARAAYSTLSVALLVVILITLVIAPARLLLLLIPGSFLLASYGMGLLLEQTTASWVPAASTESPMLTLALRLGTGISLLGFATTSFGLLGLYRFTGALIIFGLGWGIVHISRSSSDWQLFKPTLPSLVGGLVMGIVWSIAWLWATIPPTFYDELAYHLPIAQYALRTGNLPAFPWLFFSYMPHLSDLLLGWGLALAGEIGARSMHFTFWLAIWIAGWALVETIIPPHQASWIGCIMAGAFASSGTFLFLGTLPFAETSLTLAVLTSAALIALPNASALWLPLGLLWGLAISVKLSGWAWVVAGACAALVMKWPMRAVAKAGLVSLMTTMPWWGRAWWLTGNPIYPMGYHWLGGLYWSDESQARLQGDLPSYSDPFTILSLFRLPYDMVMATERFGSASDCGPLAVGIVFLMLSFPLWTLFGNLDQGKRRQYHAASLFILLTGLSWIMTSTTTRFFAPALMVGLSTLVALLTWIPKPALALSLILLSAFGMLGTSRFLSLHTQVFSSEQVALGQESAGEFARRTLDQYEAAMYVGSNLPSDANLLFIGESRPFYFDRASLSPYPFHEHPLARWVEEVDSPEQLLSKIRSEGFTHVVLNTREFRRLHDGYHMFNFSGPDALRRDQILKQLPKTMTTLFSKNSV